MNSKLSYLVKILIALLLGLVIALLIISAVWVQDRMSKVDALLNKSNDTLTQIALTARTIQATSKSFQEQLDDPETIKARKNSQLALTGALQHLAFITLPGVDETVKEVKGQTKEVGKSVTSSLTTLNESLFPAYTDLALSVKLDLSETSRKLFEAVEASSRDIRVSQKEISASLVALLESGRLTSDQLNLSASEINARVKVLLDNSNQISHNLSETTKELPPIVKTARKWQPYLNGARLTSLLLGVFLP